MAINANSGRIPLKPPVRTAVLGLVFATGALLLFAAQSQPAHAASTFTVNNTADAADASPGDGLCETATPGECTLRAAIQEANALAGTDTIDFSVSGTITLGSPLPIITGNVMIVGPNATSLAINANGTGRVFEVAAPATISDLTITGGNSGLDPSGGGILSSHPLVLTNITVSGNHAKNTGGGIASFSTLTLTNSTISGNTAGFAGGGIASFDPATLTNSTISANSAASYGGGIYAVGVPVTLKNTIVARQTAKPDCYGLVISLGHNLDSDGSCGLATGLGDLPNTNPELAPLELNPPGSTKTHALCTGFKTPDPSCGATSPAIDTGDNAGCPATDQRGVPRPLGAACDIGAYEVQPPPACGLDITPKEVVVSDGGVQVAHDGALAPGLPAGSTIPGTADPGYGQIPGWNTSTTPPFPLLAEPVTSPPASWLKPPSEPPFNTTGAQWISVSNDGKGPDFNGQPPGRDVYLYRVGFTLPADAINITVTAAIAADNYGWLYINGTQVLGPRSTRMSDSTTDSSNWLPGHQSVSPTFSSSLRPGANVLAAEVHNWTSTLATHFETGVVFSLEVCYDLPPIGGVAALTVSSSDSSVPWMPLAAVGAGVVAVMGAGLWYGRRRWLR